MDERPSVESTGLLAYLLWAFDPAYDYLRAGVPAEDWPDLYEELTRQAEPAAAP